MENKVIHIKINNEVSISRFEVEKVDKKEGIIYYTNGYSFKVDLDKFVLLEGNNGNWYIKSNKQELFRKINNL